MHERAVKERITLAEQSDVITGLEPQGDLMQLGRIHSPGELGQFERTQVAQALPLPIELQFHHQDGLLKFGIVLRALNC